MINGGKEGLGRGRGDVGGVILKGTNVFSPQLLFSGSEKVVFFGEEKNSSYTLFGHTHPGASRLSLNAGRASLKVLVTMGGGGGLGGGIGFGGGEGAIGH